MSSEENNPEAKDLMSGVAADRPKAAGQQQQEPKKMGELLSVRRID